MDERLEEELVNGGRFLKAYRTLSDRLMIPGKATTRENVNRNSAVVRTPGLDGCGNVLPCWERHSFAYITCNKQDIDVGYEIAAALSQFEPVTVCVEDAKSWSVAKRSLPDHVRVVQVFNPPKTWTEASTVAFVHGPSGDVRMVEFAGNDKKSNYDQSIFAQISEIERIYRYIGPKLELHRNKEVKMVCLDVDGTGKLLVNSNEERPDHLRSYFKTLSDFVAFESARMGANGAVIVPRGTSKTSVTMLSKKFNSVHQLDMKYLGFYVGNGGVLVPAYNHAENDARAVKVLRRVYPRRRILQVVTDRPLLNINDFVLAFYGDRVASKPGSTISRVKAARRQLNDEHLVQMKQKRAEEERQLIEKQKREEEERKRKLKEEEEERKRKLAEEEERRQQELEMKRKQEEEEEAARAAALEMEQASFEPPVPNEPDNEGEVQQTFNIEQPPPGGKRKNIFSKFKRR